MMKHVSLWNWRFRISTRMLCISLFPTICITHIGSINSTFFAMLFSSLYFCYFSLLFFFSLFCQSIHFTLSVYLLFHCLKNMMQIHVVGAILRLFIQFLAYFRKILVTENETVSFIYHSMYRVDVDVVAVAIALLYLPNSSFHAVSIFEWKERAHEMWKCEREWIVNLMWMRLNIDMVQSFVCSSIWMGVSGCCCC